MCDDDDWCCKSKEKYERHNSSGTDELLASQVLCHMYLDSVTYS
jgi:hypothetical protein